MNDEKGDTDNGMAHDDGQRLRTFHLFCGAGGGLLADLLLGHVPVGACEIEDYPRAVLLQRQRDGILPAFPIWDDICTLDGKPWRGLVDVVAGGFPCVDISCAGKGAGIEGERSGLWSEMARVVSEVRPRFVFVENSPMLAVRGLSRVLGDLSEMGFHTRHGILGGYTASGATDGKRMWVLAYEADSVGRFAPQVQAPLTYPERSSRREFERAIGACSSEEAHAGRIGDPDGMARDVDRLKAAGNGQRPSLAALAWKILTQ